MICNICIELNSPRVWSKNKTIQNQDILCKKNNPSNHFSTFVEQQRDAHGLHLSCCFGQCCFIVQRIMAVTVVYVQHMVRFDRFISCLVGVWHASNLFDICVRVFVHGVCLCLFAKLCVCTIGV